MKKLFLSFAQLFIVGICLAQFPMQGVGGRGRMGGDMMNIGHFYGKIVDAKTNKPIEFVTLQLFGKKLDTVTKKIKEGLVGGQLTGPTGEFSIDKLPLFGEYNLKISALGYATIERRLKFEVNMGKAQSGSADGMMSALNAVDKDLGNIKMEADNINLKEVTIDGNEPTMKLEMDKKVFNVEKNAVSAGGTAEDVLKTVPSVSVDVDGNVSLRNAAPQIFVDGRPSTLTIDQIPADAIQSVELITNPSAKYDASGGQGGIINIVLKKNRKMGYNGNIRGGIDRRARYNLGGDANLREGKLNFSVIGMYNQRKSISEGYTDRQNLFGTPLSNVYQNQKSVSDGYFALLRGGIDYFVDNRNTISIAQAAGQGVFKSDDDLDSRYDSLYSTGTVSRNTTRKSLTDRTFKFYNTTLSFKHNFPKEGHELTIDGNYNKSNNNGGGLFTTNYLSDRFPGGTFSSVQKQESGGTTQFLTVQSDYANPIKGKLKMELGLRTAFRKFDSYFDNSFFNPFTGRYEVIPSISSNYTFTDNVSAAYSTFSGNINQNLSGQVGLRIESSVYTGRLNSDTAKTYGNRYPFSLFPSAVISYKMSEKADVQISYSRRINRPNFFQLIPFTDYTDSLNLSRGNPALKPEFTNSMEISYLYNFSRGNNFLASVYYKNTQGIITRYQFKEYNDSLKREAVVNTYQNANESYAYGVELTAKNAPKSWLDLTTNLNIFNAVIDGSNIQDNLSNSRIGWFAKLNASFKLPKNVSIQTTGEYQSKRAMNVNSDGRGGGGGGMMRGMGGGFGGSSPATAQGYTREYYVVDVAIRYEFLKNNAATVTLGFTDILRTRVTDSYSSSDLFTQNTFRRRDWQMVRLNFSYRFGKFDVSIFKRKSIKGMMEGMQDMGGGTGGQ